MSKSRGALIFTKAERKEILEALVKLGKANVREIAEEVCFTQDIVRMRLKRMAEEGLVKYDLVKTKHRQYFLG